MFGTPRLRLVALVAALAAAFSWRWCDDKRAHQRILDDLAAFERRCAETSGKDQEMVLREWAWYLVDLKQSRKITPDVAKSADRWRALWLQHFPGANAGEEKP